MKIDRAMGATGFGEATAEARRERISVGLSVLSVLSLLFASGVALIAAFEVDGGLEPCSWRRVQGANIDQAVVVVLLTGLAGSVLILCVGKWLPLLTSVLLLVAAALSFSIALVARDSATYLASRTCESMFSDYTAYTTSTVHVAYLYGLWGAPVAVLCWTALKPWLPLLRPRPRTSPPSTERASS